jgi:hypothetical protein
MADHDHLSAKVIGVKELQATLRETDKKLLRSTQKMMRRAASPMTAQARSITPENGTLSGWAHKGRTGWRQAEVLSGISTPLGGRALSRTEWPLLTLQQRNAAGMIFDWAGRAGTSSQFVKALPRLGGVKVRSILGCCSRRSSQHGTRWFVRCRMVSTRWLAS